MTPSTPLNPRATFDTFVETASNRLAATAARTVGEFPGASYNPLLVFSAAGLGKTHLLMAIAHYARKLSRGTTTLYLTIEEFADAHRSAVLAGQENAFIRHHGEVDFLVLDDLHTLTRHPEAPAVLEAVVQHRLEANRQVVLGSRRAPQEIRGVPEVLARHLSSGLAVEISSPDAAGRLEILKRKAAEMRIEFDPGVLEAVAAIPIESVRELIGALNRLAAFQSVSPAPLDPTQARVLISGVTEPEAEFSASAFTGVPGEVDHQERPLPDPAASPLGDEFGAFLSEVVASVTEQVERWRQRVGETILYWEGEGYRTGRLEALLEHEVPAEPELVLKQFADDVARLKGLEAEAAALAPDLAGSPVFRDPDQMAAAEGALAHSLARGIPVPQPMPEFLLQEFGEGGASRNALQAALAVVAESGGKYNPLIVVGESGVGKSHLVHGIGNALIAAGVTPVACLNASTFIAEVTEHAEGRALLEWRLRYRWVAAFVLDDVHLLAGSARAQEELGLLFNHLMDQRRQLVFSSAVPIAALRGIDPRLLTRMEAGLVVDLPRPDRETRLQIVKRLLATTPAADDAALADYLASRPAENARLVHGTVQRVLSAAEAHQAALSPAFAREVLEGIDGASVRSSARQSGSRGPSLAQSGLSALRSHEKMVLEWPSIVDRLIEELR